MDGIVNGGGICRTAPAMRSVASGAVGKHRPAGGGNATTTATAPRAR
jgi:hypothetical protein